MPARTMMYKFLNTFIDDLFAFTIKMPVLHRLATLRDDVIFFVYIYQAWAYKVDYSRVNEFGQGGDEDEGVAGEGKVVGEVVEGSQMERVGADGAKVLDDGSVREGKVALAEKADGSEGVGSAREKGAASKRRKA